MLLDWLLAGDIPIPLGRPQSMIAGFFIRLKLLAKGFCAPD
jgi:hypothetical protein